MMISAAWVTGFCESCGDQSAIPRMVYAELPDIWNTDGTWKDGHSPEKRNLTIAKWTEIRARMMKSCLRIAFAMESGDICADCLEQMLSDRPVPILEPQG